MPDPSAKLFCAILKRLPYFKDSLVTITRLLSYDVHLWSKKDYSPISWFRSPIFDAQQRGSQWRGIYPFLSQLGNKKRLWLATFVFSSFTQILRWCYIWTVPFVPWVNFIHILSPLYMYCYVREVWHTPNIWLLTWIQP